MPSRPRPTVFSVEGHRKFTACLDASRVWQADPNVFHGRTPAVSEVLPGGPQDAAGQGDGRALFLCYPPPGGAMGAQSLEAFGCVKTLLSQLGRPTMPTNVRLPGSATLTAVTTSRCNRAQMAWKRPMPAAWHGVCCSTALPPVATRLQFTQAEKARTTE